MLIYFHGLFNLQNFLMVDSYNMDECLERL